MRSLELFAGAGGLALGLHEAGFEPVALLERDMASCINMKANFRGWNVIQEDVRDIDYRDFGRDIQFVTGGRPASRFRLGASTGDWPTRAICFQRRSEPYVS